MGHDDAGARAAVAGQRRDVDTTQQDLPLVGLERAGDELEQGGLAGAVWPNETQQIVLAHAQGDVVRGLYATEGL